MNSRTSRSEDSRKIMELYKSRTSKLCELHTSDSYPCEKELRSADDVAQASKEDGEFEQVLPSRNTSPLISDPVKAANAESEKAVAVWNPIVGGLKSELLELAQSSGKNRHYSAHSGLICDSETAGFVYRWERFAQLYWTLLVPVVQGLEKEGIFQQCTDSHRPTEADLRNEIKHRHWKDDVIERGPGCILYSVLCTRTQGSA
ncbi:hypothetical protein MMC29_001610 [Sticta canariensis]|nr:hypothetical protein [Sticta canariensis]